MGDLAYAIDWSATFAGFSALIAASVAGWTAWWSWDTRRRETLAKLAAARLAWVEKFRADLAELMGNLAVSGSHFIAKVPIEYSKEDRAKHLALWHRLMMDLPVGKPHLEELRSAFKDVFKDHKHTDELTKALANIEFVALAVFETERELALRELSGERVEQIRRMPSERKR